MDKFERDEHQATRRHLKAMLGIEGDSGLTNAELAARVRDVFEALSGRYEVLLVATQGVERELYRRFAEAHEVGSPVDAAHYECMADKLRDATLWRADQ